MSCRNASVYQRGNHGPWHARGIALARLLDRHGLRHGGRRAFSVARFTAAESTPSTLPNAFSMLEPAWSRNTGPYAEAMYQIPKLVVTRTLQGSLPWNATALTGDAAQTVAKLKQEPGGTSSCTAAPRCCSRCCSTA
jgi:hypothetical protein